LSNYLVIEGDSREPVSSLGLAKCLAGERQVLADRLVIIERLDPPARWKATLLRSGAVRLDALYCDQFARDDTAAQRRKRVKAYARKAKPLDRGGDGRGDPPKAVIRLADGPPWATYPSVTAAAAAAGISRQSMQRKIKNGDGWCFDGELPWEGRRAERA
jgi:hypothetical protein